MKIRIIYAQDGIYLPDHLVQKWVDDLVGTYQRHQKELFENGPDGKLTISIASELIIHGVRVAVQKGQISCEDIVFVFNNEEIQVNKEGRLDYWPKGFCDYTDKYLATLVGWEHE